jgi:hypothetical protein
MALRCVHGMMRLASQEQHGFSFGVTSHAQPSKAGLWPGDWRKKKQTRNDIYEKKEIRARLVLHFNQLLDL